MKKLLLFLTVLSIIFASCDNDDDPITIKIDNPTTYSFERNGTSTVSFSGQTTRIRMGTELIGAMSDFSSTKEDLLEMFRNETESGGDANPYADASLNASTKSIKSKVAASKDLFSTNTVASTQIKADFETWITAQVGEVFPKQNELAAPGVAGQIADGSKARYVNAKGLEYNQAFNKGLIGALMLDQIVNNYLGVAVLDADEQRTENDNKMLANDKNYTTMEHKWDEAYGYLFGNSANAADPLSTLGSDDSFLNKYLGRVEGDVDFAGIADDIYQAFKLGRAAIVAGDYDTRDEQAEIIRGLLSKVVAVRAVYYLQHGKNLLPNGDDNYGPAFHDLSEGFGFVYSLQFTRKPNSSESYFSTSEVNGFIADLTAGNGFWDITPAKLDEMSEAIAAKFDFTVAQAAE